MDRRKPKTARPVFANRGIEAKYRKDLEAIIAEMASSVEYWTAAAYRKAPPHVSKLAQDESPARKVLAALDRLARRWKKNFNKRADKIAKKYSQRMFDFSDGSFERALKEAGMTVQFKPTQAMNDALNAHIGENIALIKSIPEQYLSRVENVVMRSYSLGRDLGEMTKQIRNIYPVTKNRAALIARDQSNKANAIVSRARSLELGITEHIWMHSHGGKEPRPDHVAANGKKFKIAEGCLISGEYILPGEMINCRCSSRAVLPF